MVRFTPAERGDNPFRALALALSPLLPEGSPDADADSMAARLAAEPGWIETLAGRLLAGKLAHAELLLFADQFEELFTARVDQKHRAPFVALVEAVAAARRIRWVLSLRADYYMHCTVYPGLAALLREGSFPLAAPDVRALTEMVEGPARAAGLDVEPGPVAAIAKDAGEGPGRLALVEFALENLYDLRRNNTLSLAAYHDDLKGIAGLIQRQGDQAAQGASEAVRHELFDALSEVDLRGGAVKRRSYRDDLLPAANALASRLEDARLLTADRDLETNRAWVEVAHEAVLRDWPLFRQWLDNYGAFKLWRQGLDGARQRWVAGGRKPGRLLSSGALKEALVKRRVWPERLGEEQNDYIRRSRRRAHWQWGQDAALVMLAGLLMTWGGNAWVQWRDTRPLVPDMVDIPAGSFCMGSQGEATASADDLQSFIRQEKTQSGQPVPSACPELPPDPESLANEMPARRVQVPAFRLGRHEVTAGEFRRFVKAQQARGREFNWADDAQTVNALPPAERVLKDRLPAVNLSHDDAMAYAEWLSQETGQRYRLPTEAEWEYAARAGSLTRRWWGDDPKHEDACAHANVLDRKARQFLGAGMINIGGGWQNFACETDGYALSAPVGRYGAQGANGFGLQDMLGNVSEWVGDCYHDSYRGTPAGPEAWEDGMECASGRRVIRGGSWLYGPATLRSAARGGFPPDGRGDVLGFRLAQDLK